MKIGVTSVIGDTYRQAVNNQEIQFVPAEKALADVLAMPDLRQRMTEMGAVVMPPVLATVPPKPSELPPKS